VTTLNGQHDAFFGGINPEPIKANYVRSAAYLKQHPHDLCLVTDGDADRLGVVDERGEFVTQLQVYALLALYLLEVRGLRGPLVSQLRRGRPVHEAAGAARSSRDARGYGVQ